MKSLAVSSIALASLLTLSLSARAVDAMAPLPLQPGNSSEATPGWHFSASPYLWAAGVDGTVGQFGLPPAKLDSDFGDILGELDFAFMGMAEGRNDRFSVFSDIIYSKISMSDASPKGVLTQSIDVTSQTFTGFFGGGYSVLANGRDRLDVIAGARVWYASTELSLQGRLLDGINRTDSATWVNAVAGVRGTYFLSERVYLTGWGNVGAGQAKLDWDVAAAVGYQIKDSLSAVAGYRALGVDYSNDGFVFDVVQQGPILGLTYHF
ncbi:hypothetical protein [Aminobacter sp. AP02]|uniref:hypothetical protein n=1 Tax=Aminobacter sp. AP02 TaxID=2135737 RepID=UPI000D6B83E5|nr:hypothetical protein [Aminobacter sp. AP02]